MTEPKCEYAIDLLENASSYSYFPERKERETRSREQWGNVCSKGIQLKVVCGLFFTQDSEVTVKTLGVREQNERDKKRQKRSSCTFYGLTVKRHNLTDDSFVAYLD